MVLCMRAILIRAAGLRGVVEPEARIAIMLFLRVCAARCGPADICEAFLGAIEKPAHICLPDTCCFILRSAYRVVVLGSIAECIRRSCSSLRSVCGSVGVHWRVPGWDETAGSRPATNRIDTRIATEPRSIVT